MPRRVLHWPCVAAVDPWWTRLGDKLKPETRRKFGEFVECFIELEMGGARNIRGLLTEGKEDTGQEPSRPNDKAAVRRNKANLAARFGNLGRTLLSLV